MARKKTVVTVQLDCASLIWSTRHLQTDKEHADWLRSFLEAMATNKEGINDFADSLIADVHEYREEKAEQMRILRENRNVPEVTELTEHSPTSSLVLSSLKVVFDEARKAYPGTKNGIDREWANFRAKQKKNIAQIVPLILPAIQREIAYKAYLKKSGEFCPSWANFQTWINGERWTQEFTALPKPEKRPHVPSF